MPEPSLRPWDDMGIPEAATVAEEVAEEEEEVVEEEVDSCLDLLESRSETMSERRLSCDTIAAANVPGKGEGVD